jgi:hypothetical protein
MKVNWILFVVLVIFFSSCKREFISVKTTTTYTKSFAPDNFSDNVQGQMAAGMASEENTPMNISHSIPEKKLFPKKVILKEEISSENKIIPKTKKEIKKDNKQKKEKDPRLTTALLMIIFGGIATTLGIVFNQYAPTGLFVFVFGIIFIIGVISLCMYLANPKPKM